MIYESKTFWIVTRALLVVIIILLATLITALTLQSLPTQSIISWKTIGNECNVASDNDKFDCYQLGTPSQSECEERGCCWMPVNVANVPRCFYPSGYRTYVEINATHFADGVTAYWALNFKSPYPNDVQIVRFRADYQTKYRLRIKLEDGEKSRFESIYPIINESTDSLNTSGREYLVQLSKTHGGFLITRPNGRVIFDAVGVGGFIFADQFLQISVRFHGVIYGLGEHQSPLPLDNNWATYTMWNSDTIPLENTSLYGSHPFYLVMDPDGTAHGVFLKNSNAMDVTIQPLPALTIRAIGGLFDFYFFTGPNPADVISQYTELIGRPAMPPFWALGYHLSRLGYKNVSHMKTVLERNVNVGIPVDGQWVDIDYMMYRNDFTLNDVAFNELPQFVNELHTRGIHFVPILDAGISAGEPNGTYPPFDDGIELGVLVKNEDGSPFIGKVWNKKRTAFPDFTNNQTFQYWNKQLRFLHNIIPYDGIWLDMNEPSNFIDGSVNGCREDNLENPPYVPQIFGGKLRKKTLCMSAVHAAGSHYNIHNVYGISQAHATHSALSEILKKRALVISRSTFPGIGAYAGHWSGDVASSWHDMKRTISQMLSFSLFGVPLMGSDICGFNGNTSEHLCMRWSQLGAFYPFSRNHNTDDALDQDPAALGANVVVSAREALTVRYTLLPYLYNLFWRAHVAGETVARPLFLEFANDVNTYGVDESFLWGCCLLVVPVLEDGATTVRTYLPAGRWYDWYSRTPTDSPGHYVHLNAPSHSIPLFIRGGAILPTQTPHSNTYLSRCSKLWLLVAADSNRSASGYIYWDDGISLDVSKAYGVVDFTLNASELSNQVRVWSTDEVLFIEQIQILGFVKVVTKLFLNGESYPFTWNSTSLVLDVNDLDLPVHKPFIVTWR